MAGFKSVEVVRNNIQYQEVLLPAMIKVKGQLFQLVTIAGSQLGDQSILDSLGVLSGNYAEYIAVPDMGSTGATAVGFVFPNLKETSEVQKVIKEANPNSEDGGNKFTKDPIPSQDYTQGDYPAMDAILEQKYEEMLTIAKTHNLQAITYEEFILLDLAQKTIKTYLDTISDSDSEVTYTNGSVTVNGNPLNDLKSEIEEAGENKAQDSFDIGGQPTQQSSEFKSQEGKQQTTESVKPSKKKVTTLSNFSRSYSDKGFSKEGGAIDSRTPFDKEGNGGYGKESFGNVESITLKANNALQYNLDKPTVVVSVAAPEVQGGRGSAVGFTIEAETEAEAKILEVKAKSSFNKWLKQNAEFDENGKMTSSVEELTPKVNEFSKKLQETLDTVDSNKVDKSIKDITINNTEGVANENESDIFGNSSETTLMLTEFYDSLTIRQKQILATFEIKSTKDLIKESEKNQYGTTEEFIEEIKQCFI